MPTDDTIQVTVLPEPNKAPVANAGGDITLTLPNNSTSLNGSASSDPNGNNTIASHVRDQARDRAPTQFTLANPAQLPPRSPTVPGTYTFELIVTDNGGLTDKDTVTVTVHPQPNRAPMAHAGSDITITLPVNSTVLNGTAFRPRRQCDHRHLCLG